MPKDFLFNDSANLMIENGDLLVDESTIHHQKLLLQLNKGDLKEYPTACVGIARYLKDEDPMGMLGEIKRECESDGMEVKEVTINASGKLKLEAYYGY
jgi:hypothetical protein